MNYFPHPPLILLLFLLALAVVLLLLRYVLVGWVYERLGLSRGAAIGILIAALLGSGVNIPLFRLPAERVLERTVVYAYGMYYIVPHVVERGHTIIAVNLGGAVIPLLLVVYLLARHGIHLRMVVAFAVETLVVYLLARPVAGVGVVMPPLVPAIVAGAVAVALDWHSAPRTAYIAGTLGTLVGADLLNLGRINELGAPVASIGGAGTFDGIFVTGVIAVLLAGIPLSWRRRRPADRERLPDEDLGTREA